MCVASPQTAIQLQYDKMCQAARHRFLDGILSVRAPSYVAYNALGHAMGRQQELENLGGALKKAASVDEAVKILDCRMVGATEAQLTVHDLMQFLWPGDLAAGRAPIMVETLSRDTWVYGTGGWRLQTSRILSQRSRRDPGYVVPATVR
jgi:hypothetical protein